MPVSFLSASPRARWLALTGFGPHPCEQCPCGQRRGSSSTLAIVGSSLDVWLLPTTCSPKLCMPDRGLLPRPTLAQCLSRLSARFPPFFTRPCHPSTFSGHPSYPTPASDDSFPSSIAFHLASFIPSYTSWCSNSLGTSLRRHLGSFCFFPNLGDS